MLSLGPLLFLAIVVGACVSASSDTDQDQGTCLPGSVENASAACHMLSLAYPGQVHLPNGTNITKYKSEAEGKAVRLGFVSAVLNFLQLFGHKKPGKTPVVSSPQSAPRISLVDLKSS